MIETNVQNGGSGSGEVEEHYPEFFISQEQAFQTDRSLPLMIVGRMNHADKQAFEDKLDPAGDIKELIDRVVETSSKDPDYLLPDTPLKEAIFRVILANGNEPMTAEDISELLSERWAMTAYPRDVSPQVIQRLLENSLTYGIVKVPEPEEEELEAEAVAEVAEGADADSEDKGDGGEEASEEEAED